MDKKNSSVFRKKLDKYMKFDKEIYTKSAMRYVIYVILFIHFLWGWFVPFMEWGGISFIGSTSFLIYILTYSGTLHVVSEERRVKSISVCNIYNLDRNIYALSKMVIMAEWLKRLIIIFIIQTILELAVFNAGNFVKTIIVVFTIYLICCIIVWVMETVIKPKRIF